MESYTGFLPNNIPLSTTIGIENKLNFSSQYHSLENHVNGIQAPELEEPEDPPETIHTPWGVWLHHRDALHSIDQRYDTEHVLRTTHAAEDILHYYHYAPVIGEHEYKPESYEMNFEYDYSHEEPIYNTNIKFEGEDVKDVETTLNVQLEEDSDDEPKHMEPNEEKSLFADKEDKELKNNSDFKFDKELTKIFEKVLKFFAKKNKMSD